MFGAILSWLCHCCKEHSQLTKSWGCCMAPLREPCSAFLQSAPPGLVLEDRREWTVIEGYSALCFRDFTSPNPPKPCEEGNHDSHLYRWASKTYWRSKEWSQFCFGKLMLFSLQLLPQIMKAKRENRKASEIIVANLSLIQGSPRTCWQGPILPFQGSSFRYGTAGETAHFLM